MIPAYGWGLRARLGREPVSRAPSLLRAIHITRIARKSSRRGAPVKGTMQRSRPRQKPIRSSTGFTNGVITQ